MSENGFTFIGRSIKRNFQSFVNSPTVTRIKGKLSNRKTSKKEFVTIFDAEITQKLSEMAQQEDMDTGPFVLELLNDVLQAQGEEMKSVEIVIALWQQLTKREQEVAALACKGLTNPQIGKALHISEETVKTHMRSILHKFNIKGRGVLRWMLEGWDFDNPQSPWET